jgi:predicted ATPase with chaperone activity
MVARVQTVAFSGIDVLAVDAQVTIASGLPAFHVVGLPDKAVGESRERVRAALHALGLALPPKRITVNLAPADLAKEGSLLRNTFPTSTLKIHEAHELTALTARRSLLSNGSLPHLTRPASPRRVNVGHDPISKRVAGLE